MELPTNLIHTLHKHRGRITRIDSIHHSVDPPENGYSRDTWFFLGDVEWSDGGKSELIQIHPSLLCYDKDHREEVFELSEMMAKYLAENGTWDHEKRPRGWNANR
jgi:hypothetical protein